MASVDAAEAIKIPRTQAYSEHLAREFQQLRVDGELTDFVIHTSTRSYRCHQTILASVSPVLKAMLRSAMAEASKQEVKLEHIEADIMEILLMYMYTGEVYIPQEKLVPTIEASDFLQLLELKELCLSEAVVVCSPSNAVSMYKLANELDVESLKTKCAELMSSSLAEISKFEEFYRLQSTELSSFLSGAQESDVDPDDLLEATLDWIDYKSDQRVTSMENLVEKIDISECTVECLEREIEKHEELLIQCPKVSVIFTKGMVQIAKQRGSRRKYRGKRGTNAKIIVIGGEEGETLNKVCWEWNEAGFNEVCDIQGHSVKFAVCMTPNGFALTGGKGCQLCSVFDMTTKVWESLQSLRQPRYVHGAACFDGKISVYGGWVSGSQSSSVQSLKIGGGEWTDEPDIPQAVRYPEVASVNSGIYLLDTLDSKKLFYLDIETKVWSTRAPVPSLCTGARMVCVDDQLLVAGGTDVYSNSSRMFAHYNISTDTWTTGLTPSMNHYFGAMFYANRKLYLMGGQDEDRVEEYNMDMESWSVSDVRVPLKLRNLHALVLYT